MDREEGIGGPWVTAALFAERILTEKDDVVTLVRVVDRFTATLPDDEPEAASLIEATLIVRMKAGDFRGDTEVAIEQIDPTGRRRRLGRTVGTLNGSIDGFQITLDAGIAVAESGVHWFDIVVNGRSASRTPLQFDIHRVPRAEFEAAGATRVAPPSPDRDNGGDDQS